MSEHNQDEKEKQDKKKQDKETKDLEPKQDPKGGIHPIGGGFGPPPPVNP